MGNYFSTSNTESITIINETDHVHVVMSDSHQVTNENKNVNEEKTSIINSCDKEELKVDTAVIAAADKVAVAAADKTAVIAAADKVAVIAAADKTAVIADTKVTSTICKKNVKKNKKNKKKHNQF
jgi:hypothetical protein